jgi:hypothetical protein
MMPKKKNPETQEQQSARFNAEVERLIAAGELSPTDAEAALDKLLGAIESSAKAQRPERG